MQQLQPQDLKQLLPYLPIALLALGLIAYVCARGIRRLLPVKPTHTADWSGAEVLAAHLIVILLPFAVLPLVAALLPATGLYPSTLIAAAADPDEATAINRQIEWTAGSTAAAIWNQQVDHLRRILQLLWTGALALPLQILAMPMVLWLASRTAPADIGLTRQHVGRNVLLGMTLWFALAPLVIGMHAIVEMLQGQLLPEGASPHPFTQMFLTGLRPVEMSLLVLIAVVGAPLIEELLFRGVTQGWATRDRRHAGVVMAVCLAESILFRSSEISMIGSNASRPTWLNAFAPMLYVLLMGLIFGILWKLGASAKWLGIFSTSLLFGMSHVAVWPSPIALFVLGFGVGWLARRTGSLCGPIVLHAMFNSIACAQLLVVAP